MTSGYLPFDRTKVTLNQNELLSDYTINRSTNRLLYNDKKLLEYINNVGLTQFINGISGSIDPLSGTGVVSLNYPYIDQQFILSGYYPNAGISRIDEADDYIGSDTSACTVGNLLAITTDPSGNIVWTNNTVTIPSAHDYESHANVQIDTNGLVDGQALVWDSTLNKWINRSTGGVFKTNIQYITFTTYNSYPITETTGLNTYDLSLFSTTEYGQLNSANNTSWVNLRGIFVQCTIPNINSSIIASIIPNSLSATVISSSNNNTSILTSLQYIPVTRDQHLIMNSENGGSYKIMGAFIETIRPVYHEVDFIHVKANVVVPPIGTFYTSGYVTNSTYDGGSTQIFSSYQENPNNILTSWANLFPIKINDFVTKTEITYYGNGTSIENNGIITIDWNNNTIGGFVNCYKDAEYYSFYFSGTIINGIDINAAKLNYSGAFDWTNCLPEINLSSDGYYYYINKLPKADACTNYSDTGNMVTNLGYSIKNYKSYYQPVTLNGN